MREYPDNQLNVTLPDPGEGYKWELVEPNVVGDVTYRRVKDVIYRKVKVAKLYDWSKVGDSVLVVGYNGDITPLWGTGKPQYLVTNFWQAHIGGDPCPVHAEATMVEIMGQPILAGKASGYSWKTDTIYRVTGLAPGYKYL